MTALLKYEQEKIDFDSLPEYVRESEHTSRDAFVNISYKALAARASNVFASSRHSASHTGSIEHVTPKAIARDSQRDTGGFARVTSDQVTYGDAPRTDELEALWPGVHHDFLHSPKRTPSFYMMLGFMGGAFVSMIAVWAFSGMSTIIAHNPGKTAPVAVAGQPGAAQQAAPAVATAPQGSDPSAVLVPAHPTVVISTGDTLAAIALREYKRVSPRLLDEICRSNGLKNANFLNLGQKISLPNYQAQTTQMAAAPQAQVH
jgi:hypothetical protein